MTTIHFTIAYLDYIFTHRKLTEPLFIFQLQSTFRQSIFLEQNITILLLKSEFYKHYAHTLLVIEGTTIYHIKYYYI